MIKTLLILSWKNLKRHTKRTVITSSAISFGIALLIWTDGLLKWADNESKRNLIRYEFGNFIICTKDFKQDKDNFPVNKVLNKRQINKIKSIAEKYNCYIAPRTGFKSFLSFNRNFGIPYIVYAVNPDLDFKVFKIKNSVIKGTYLNNNEDGILISEYCKKNLNVDIGDYITIETKTRYDTYQAVQVKITGIYRTPDPVVDRNQVFITSKFADRNLQTEGTATIIAVKTENNKNEPYLSKIKAAIKKERGLSNLTEITWQEAGKDYLLLSRSKRGASKIIIIFIFVIVAVGIVNTMLMAVFERTKEIGMLRALGIRDKYVVLSFIFESAGIGLLGSLIGVILGIIANAYSVTYGLDFSSALKDIDIGYRVGTIGYNEWNPKMMLGAFIFGITISILVSIIPARKAVKLKITESVNN